ncbi:NADP-dependent oxidoreductase [Bounagaea algeriensis]
MQAIALTEFGEPDVLAIRDVPEPLLGPDAVLVEVRGAGVNPVDWKIRRGYLSGMIPHHTPLTPGWDVSGVVRAVGPAVTEFRAGDEVLGYVREDHVQNGAYAELMSAPLRGIAHKPAGLDFTRAGALPLAGLTALQLLHACDVGRGDTVLVHAASGGVGHFAVQLAKELGAARVIGTASERNHDFLAELGAEPITYGEWLPERVAELVGGDGKVDAVIDVVGGQSLADAPRMLHEPHRFASVADEPENVLQLGGQYVFVRPNAEQLAWLAELAANGRLRIEVQQTYSLAQAADAHRLLEEGHVRGKLVLDVF